jgi:hypothetical protein
MPFLQTGHRGLRRFNYQVSLLRVARPTKKTIF